MKKKYLLTGVLYSALYLCANAQDPHFSQYFSSPLTLNPATAGNFEGAHRLAFNYRNQASANNTPYSTAALSYDTRLLKNKIKEGDIFGLGISLLHDETAGGILNSSYVALTAAYHKAIDADGYQRIGIGFQGTLATRKLDGSKLTYSEQFNGSGFDASIPSGEQITHGSINYADLNAGAIYNYDDDVRTFYAGVSYYHITHPREDFYFNSHDKLEGRISLHAGGSMLLGETGRVFVSGLYMKQGQATEKTLGLSYSYFIQNDPNEIAVTAGCWYRFSDALYPYIGIRWNGLQAGFTYDINTSSITGAASRSRSLELSCIYVFRDNSALKKLIPWY